MDIKKIAHQLEHTGYIVLAKPLVDKLLAELFTRCHDDEPARFHAAHVGRGAAKKQIGSIRSDVINWLDADRSCGLRHFQSVVRLNILRPTSRPDLCAILQFKA